MHRTSLGLVLTMAVLGAAAVAADAAAISESDLKELRESFQLSLWKKKGPFAENYCLCADGAKEPVAGPDGKTPRARPCGDRAVLHCAAERAPHTEPLLRRGLYVANVFARDVHTWDSYKDHHNLVRGYILENYFVETHPEHKFAQMRAYGGLSGAEYEVPAARKLYESYLSLPDWTDFRHYLLSYELQRRFFVREDVAQIKTIRALSLRLRGKYAKFKPICDAIHNRISPGHVEKVVGFRDTLPPDSADRAVCDTIAEEIRKLTRLGEADLTPQLAALEDATLRAKLGTVVAAAQNEPGSAASIGALASLLVEVRTAVGGRKVSASDARKLLDLAITAATLVHARTTALLDAGRPRTVREGLELMLALTDATYGTGLLSQREREAATARLQRLLAVPAVERKALYEGLQRAEQIVTWAQNTVRFSFAEVLPVWTVLMPDVAFVADDILRASPLLVYAQVVRRLQDHVGAGLHIEHHVAGSALRRGARALNPGLALGRLRFAPAEGSYTREDIVALLETPAELQPTAGILTQGEGNVVSHVQLLARSLGIPNVVLEPAVMKQLAALDGKQVVLLVTPLGRVLLKEASGLDAAEREIVAEYTRNKKRRGEGALDGAAGSKLAIDPRRLALDERAPIDLAAVGRADSGVRSGPKAAFLGELRRLFPQAVSRGIVLPFGVYYEHYRAARVAVPRALRAKGLAAEGEPLPAFVERTYAEFFGKLAGPAVAGGRLPETELVAWIRPRLEIVQHSLRSAPLSPTLRADLRAELERQGLLLDASGRMVGCFVRSDTNVEDQPNFNGAGLNLTIFNVTSFEKLLDGIKEVWASPFSYRSFSWRQTLIDEPLWVLPSIVILESVPSEKSGVLITADVYTGEPGTMTVGTSEGVGGAVDGSPAEELVWSPHGVELLSQFKSPWRRLLLPQGGVAQVASTGSERVLEPEELEQLVAAAQKIHASLPPETDPAGQPRPWDIEFGFVGGKLWLFQVRAFAGNDEINNLPALVALDRGATAALHETLSLDEPLLP